jgi:hypothetical protein
MRCVDNARHFGRRAKKGPSKAPGFLKKVLFVSVLEVVFWFCFVLETKSKAQAKRSQKQPGMKIKIDRVVKKSNMHDPDERQAGQGEKVKKQRSGRS